MWALLHGLLTPHNSRLTPGKGKLPLATNQMRLHRCVSLTTRSLFSVQHHETPKATSAVEFDTLVWGELVCMPCKSTHCLHFCPPNADCSSFLCQQPVQLAPATVDMDEESQLQLALSLSKEEHQQVRFLQTDPV